MNDIQMNDKSNHCTSDDTVPLPNDLESARSTRPVERRASEVKMEQKGIHDNTKDVTRGRKLIPRRDWPQQLIPGRKSNGGKNGHDAIVAEGKTDKDDTDWILALGEVQKAVRVLPLHWLIKHDKDGLYVN